MVTLIAPNCEQYDEYGVADMAICAHRRTALLAGAFAIKIMIAEPQVLFRSALISLLNDQHDIEVIAAAGNGKEAVRLAKDRQPDVVVMNIAMPELNGIEAARQIHAAYPETGIVMLSIHSTAELVHDALRAGALGYLLKEAARGEVVAAVRFVAEGRQYLSQKLTNILRDLLASFE